MSSLFFLKIMVMVENESAQTKEREKIIPQYWKITNNIISCGNKDAW